MLKWAFIIAGVSGLLLLITVIISASRENNQPNGTVPTPVVTPGAQGYQSEPGPLDPSKGLILGQLCQNEQGTLDPMMIVAEELPGRIPHEKFYPGQLKANTNLYYLEVDPGLYEVYTRKLNGDRWGLYSDYVVCGQDSFCVDHGMIEVQVNAGDVVSGIDICDYAWNQR